ncbi:hypothetical protein U1Q18_027631 [Sarracenia purpurea var. burkii]
MALPSSESNGTRASTPHLIKANHNQFFIWREFLWGAIAGAFGEGMMHPIDTVKTRIQSQVILCGSQNQKSILQMVRTVWVTDGLRGFYRGIAPGITGSLATGATYFGVIESTKKWIEEEHPSLGGHWAHFIAGAVAVGILQKTRNLHLPCISGDTLGSFVYVPCEVIKQRMQGLKGLYAGYWSTLARDVPFAGLVVTFYEALKDVTEYGKKTLMTSSGYHANSSLEGLLLGGLAGGFSAYLTTPFDVVKTRLQIQGSTLRYNGWLDAVHKIWSTEGIGGMFRGSIPRVMWYVPASALTFMAVEFLRDHFNEALNDDKLQEVANLSIDKKGSSLQKVS